MAKKNDPKIFLFMIIIVGRFYEMLAFLGRLLFSLCFNSALIVIIVVMRMGECVYFLLRIQRDLLSIDGFCRECISI